MTRPQNPSTRWDATFDEPLRLPNGRMARTLKEAARYITKLPFAEHEHPTVKIAVRSLIEAAEGRGTLSFARIGVLQAINRNEEPRLGPGKVVSNGIRWRSQ